jgi:hypothetical protein
MKTSGSIAMALASLALLALAATAASAAGPADPAMAVVHGDIGDPAPGAYIVQLAGEPVATYRGGLPGLPATSPDVTGTRRLDPRSPESLAYETYLEGLQAAFLDRVTSRIGKRPGFASPTDTP